MLSFLKPQQNSFFSTFEIMSIKKLLSSFFVIITLNSFSQIISKQNPSISKDVSAKNKISKDTNSKFYIEASYVVSFRTLESNINFLNTPLGERVNETKLPIWNYTFGMTVPISKLVYFDGGMSILRNGEQYSWESTTSDSSFNYQTNYNYLALPLQLKIQGGNKFKYFIGAGIVPQIYLSYKQEQQWTDSLGSKRNKKETVNNENNSFAFSWIVSAGIELEFENKFGLRLSANYRSQLNNTYTKYNDYIHKANAIGFNLALTRTF